MSFSLVLQLLSLCACAAYCAVLGLLVWQWQRKRSAGNAGGNAREEASLAAAPIAFSIIVAARNEAVALRRLLPAILAQEWAAYEIVLALDRCTDDSLAVAQAFQANYPERVRIVEIDALPDGWTGKKNALNRAIAAASHAWLVFTDADCLVPPTWLPEVAAAIADSDRVGDSPADGTELVLGLGMYTRYAGLLNALVRFETVWAALQYVAFARLGLPYMGVGRNLAYTRTLYARAGGFGAHRGRLSGDDDLLVNHAATASNTVVMLAPASVTYSEPKRTWREWLHQKRRHLSASTAYSLRTKIALAVFHGLFMASLGGIFCTIAIFPVTFLPMVALYTCRTVISGILFGTVARKVREKELTLLFPLLELLFFCYTISIVPLGLTAKPTAWKN